MKRFMTGLLLLALCAAPAMARLSPDEKRAKIDANTAETLERLFEKNPGSNELFESAYGYAVFDTIKVSLIVTGGGGVGVAVDKKTGTRTYMKMGTGGLNLGAGGQKYRVVFFFETKRLFDDFVEHGWQADASANAVVGDRGANASATFRNGLAVWQLTEAGIMLQADIAGTKYWKSGKLNK